MEHMKGSLGIACSGTDSSGLQAGEATEGPRVKGGVGRALAQNECAGGR